MKTLELNQMEIIDGGFSLGCGFAIFGAGIALGSLIVASGGTAGVVLAAAGWSIAPSAVLLGCMKQ